MQLCQFESFVSDYGRVLALLFQVAWKSRPLVPTGDEEIVQGDEGGRAPAGSN